MEALPRRASTAFAKEYFKGRTDLVVAEIGVREGDNANNILDVLNPKLLLLVDIWTLDSDWDKIRRDIKEKERTILIRGRSVEVAKQVNLKFDFIYIDADHTEESVREDSLIWLPKVKSGGIIGGHDFHNNDFPGVMKAVTQIFNNIQFGGFHAWAGTDWWTIV